MNRALQLLILLGAMLGLFGQQVACAAGAYAGTSPVVSARMSVDCMEMMQKEQPRPEHRSGKDISHDCVASMGCLVPLAARDTDEALERPSDLASPVFWPETTVLLGTEIPPEQHPPSILR